MRHIASLLEGLSSFDRSVSSFRTRREYRLAAVLVPELPSSELPQEALYVASTALDRATELRLRWWGCIAEAVEEAERNPAPISAAQA